MLSIVLRLSKLKIRIIAIVFALIVVTPLFCYWQNNDIVTTRLNIIENSIPEEFDNFKIVQVSDLHNKLFGNNQSRLINKISRLSPDIIAVTGDLIDRRHTDVDTAMLFVAQAVKIAPVYYVSGNHEAWSGVYPKLKEKLTGAGVTVLDNDISIINRNDAQIALLGLSDYSFFTGDTAQSINNQFENTLAALAKSAEGEYTVLLSHRPEKLDIYWRHGVNLVFSGHAHGGQVRLPFIGGLAAPDQGLLPKYTAGLYNSGDTSMIVSRGLGNSIFPQRVFNRPELVLAELKSK